VSDRRRHPHAAPPALGAPAHEQGANGIALGAHRGHHLLQRLDVRLVAEQVVEHLLAVPVEGGVQRVLVGEGRYTVARWTPARSATALTVVLSGPTVSCNVTVASVIRRRVRSSSAARCETQMFNPRAEGDA
jgi:hypothetical protein